MLKGMRDFQIPTKVEVDKESVTATYGRFTAEPFERGFGTTVGNSLRRVLLSSLSGAAVVSVKIEGVLHEFSTIPGITEDVTDIILNVKKIRFKLHADKTKTLRLRKKGPGVAKAGEDRKSTRLNSSHLVISYAVFCLKKKKTKRTVCIT